MRKFRFEIQSLVTEIIEAENVVEARLKVLEYLEEGNYDICFREECSVSDGVEIKGD